MSGGPFILKSYDTQGLTNLIISKLFDHKSIFVEFILNPPSNLVKVKLWDLFDNKLLFVCL